MTGRPTRVGVGDRDPQFVALLESAAHLQRLVPGAVLVGGTAAILYADHRESSDHDHVLADLADRFEMVLEAVEEDEGWATNRVAPGKVILGNLDGIEAGVRQMIRKVPLEVATLILPSGAELTVPTIEETLRIKAFLIVRRNQTRDYLDLAALSEHIGVDQAAEVLVRIDNYYADQHEEGEGVASQLMRQLSDPQPADRSVIAQLSSYRRLRKRWSDWGSVTEVLGGVATRMVES
ncbi:MAG TPA: nucleotidyl transferase AbiEii/AbiGii toxin family protein [Solirubrobacterales bacterium]|nr:nucleotidyl transferase AbiEii/AbiGii toxin family protein [Solirubrobacterales bacterium]